MFLISQLGSPLLGRKADQNHFCKVVIFGWCFLGFYSVSNFIVFFQSFPYMFVRFNVRIECEKLVKNCEQKTIRDWLTSGQPTKSHMRSIYQMLKLIFLVSIHSCTHTIKAHITHYWCPFFTKGPMVEEAQQ